MKKVFWLLPALVIFGMMFLSPVIVAASSPLKAGISRISSSFAPAAEGNAGIDVIWIAMGSVGALIIILLVVTFVILPKRKAGQTVKQGNRQASKDNASKGARKTAQQNASRSADINAKQYQSAPDTGNLPGQGLPMQPQQMQRPQGIPPQPPGQFSQPSQQGMPVQPRPMQPQGMQPQPPGQFSQPTQRGMPVQPRPMQPQGMQPQPPGQFSQPTQRGMPVQPRPMQPQGMQPQPPGQFSQPSQQGMPVQPRPMQPQGMQPQGMQPQPPGQFSQPTQQGMPVQPRPMQPQGMQPQPPGQFSQPSQQGMMVQPQPMQPMPQGIPVPPKLVQGQPYQPAGQSRPVYQVPARVPIQPRPVPPVPTTPQMFPQGPYQAGIAPFPGIQIQGAPLFRVSNLVITPNQVKADDPVSISATVYNQGSNAGQHKLVLRVNGMIEGISELTINPGMSQVAMFSVAKNAPGNYLVEADNLQGAFIVMPRSPAAFTISNLTIDPEKVKQGESTAMSFIVTNAGDSAGNYTAVVKIKGIDEIIEDIPIEPNSSQRVTFNIFKEAAGFYPVSIEDLNARFVVEMDWKL